MNVNVLLSGRLKLDGYGQGKPVDLQVAEYVWHCPQCGEDVRFPNLLALCLAERAGGCQGCRAKATFEQNPGLITLFLDFWARTDGWPQSSSWVEAVHMLDIA